MEIGSGYKTGGDDVDIAAVVATPVRDDAAVVVVVVVVVVVGVVVGVVVAVVDVVVDVGVVVGVVVVVGRSEYKLADYDAHSLLHDSVDNPFKKY